MIHIDEVRLVELLDKAVAERGENYQYERPLVPLRVPVDRYSIIPREARKRWRTMQVTRCVYVESSTGERQPSCLAGMVLYLAGVPLETLDVDPMVTINDLLNDLLQQDVVSVDLNVQTVLTYVQQAQDRGTSWGSIVANVRTLIERGCTYRALEDLVG